MLIPAFDKNKTLPQKVILTEGVLEIVDDNTEKEPASLAFSFSLPREIYINSPCKNFRDDNYISLKPFRFNTDYELLFTYSNGHYASIYPLNTPGNSIIPENHELALRHQPDKGVKRIMQALENNETYGSVV